MYAAIDFETSLSSPDSACSVGITKFEGDGSIIGKYYSLIRPKFPVFDPLCMSVHGLEPSDILDAPTFKTLWPGIGEFIGDAELVAHNAAFDMRVLKESLSSWGIDVPRYRYYCTLSLSRILLPDEESHALSALANKFGWKYSPHNALDDSRVSAYLFLMLCAGNLSDEERERAFFRDVYRKSKRKFPRTLL